MQRWLVRVLIRRIGVPIVVIAVAFLALANAGLFGTGALITRLGQAALAVITAPFFVATWLAKRSETRERADLDALLETVAARGLAARRREDPASLNPGVSLLPVAWSNVKRAPVTATSTGDAPEPERTAGRFTGTSGELAAKLARSYSTFTGDRRLLIIGAPGSGKSTLGRLLCIGTAEARQPGEPVLVLVRLSTWDQRLQLLPWIAEAVAAELGDAHPQDLLALLRDSRLVPVLDGLDELPESLRPAAVQAVNDSFADRPVVVTCRQHEYDELIAATGLPLRLTSTMTTRRVEPRHVLPFVGRVAPHADAAWRRVGEELSGNPDGPLATALATPLMVRLYADAYRRQGDPAEVLARDRFGDARAITDHLLDTVITAAYPEREPGSPWRLRGNWWTAARARRWLAFLAAAAEKDAVTDIRWWRLSAWTLPAVVAPLFALLLGVGVLVAFRAATPSPTDVSPLLADDSQQQVSRLGLVWSGIACLIVVVVVITVWQFANASAPRRWGLTRQRVRSAFTGSLLIGPFLTLLIVLAWMIFVISAEGHEWVVGDIVLLGQVLTACLAAGLTLAAVVALHRMLTGSALEPVSAEPPRRQVRRDRNAACLAALTTGLVTAAVLLPITRLGARVGITGVEALTGWPGWPGEPHFAGPTAAGQHGALDDLGLTVFGGGGSRVLFSATPAVVVAVVTLLLHPWPRFALSRTLSASRGRLPLLLMAFLDDAAERKVLRVSGASYGFWHRSLQQRLAADPWARRAVGLVDSASPVSATASLRRRRGRLVIAAAAVPALVLAWFALPKDGADAVVALPNLALGTTSAGAAGIVDIEMAPDPERRFRGGHLRWNADSGITSTIPGGSFTVDPVNGNLITETVPGEDPWSLATMFSVDDGSAFPALLAPPQGFNQQMLGIWNRNGRHVPFSAGPVSSVKVSPAGEVMLTYDSQHHVAAMYRTTNGHPVGTPIRDVTSAAFTEDGGALVTLGARGQLSFWAPDTGAQLPVAPLPVEKPLKTFDAEDMYVDETGYAIRPVGPVVLGAFRFITQGSPRFITEGSPRRNAGAMRVTLWNARTGRLLPGPGPGEFDHIEIGAAGDSLLTLTFESIEGNGGLHELTPVWTAQLWDTLTGTALGPPIRHVKGARFVSPDRIVAQTTKKNYQLYDARSGNLIRDLKHAGDDVFDVPGRLFGLGTACGEGLDPLFENICDNDGTMELVDNDGLPVAPPIVHLASGAVSKDGSLLVTWDYREQWLWDLGGDVPHRIAPVRGTSVAFSPDGDVVALYDSPESTARVLDDRVWVYDSATGEQLAVLNGHTGPVMRVTYSPDGQSVVTTGADSTVRIWKRPKSYHRVPPRP